MRKSSFETNQGVLCGFSEKEKGELLSAKTFIEATNDFLNANYKGIINLTSSISSHELISISARHLIFLFKRIVDASKLNKLINVNISCNSESFSIRLSCFDGSRFDCKFEREIIKTGRAAGFDIYRDDLGLCLETKVIKPAAITVFTILTAKIQLEKLYREIFYGDGSLL